MGIPEKQLKRCCVNVMFDVLYTFQHCQHLLYTVHMILYTHSLKSPVIDSEVRTPFEAAKASLWNHLSILHICLYYRYRNSWITLASSNRFDHQDRLCNGHSVLEDIRSVPSEKFADPVCDRLTKPEPLKFNSESVPKREHQNQHLHLLSQLISIHS